MSKWQRVTSPENGVNVLGFFPDFETPVMIVHWIKTDDPEDTGDWYEQNIDKCTDPLWADPTHWMPLPDPPS